MAQVSNEKEMINKIKGAFREKFAHQKSVSADVLAELAYYCVIGTIQDSLTPKIHHSGDIREYIVFCCYENLMQRPHIKVVVEGE